MQGSGGEFQFGTVKSKDGTQIGYRMIGQGPGLLIVHGGFRAAQHYEKLARALANSFTVYVMDRRGRNESGPRGEAYSVQKECEDVIALLEQLDVSSLFGHSYGGLISMQVALQRPLTKLAVYEPATMIQKYLPTDWVPRFERELAREDFISASVTFLKGMQMGGVIGKMPRLLLRMVFRFFAKGPDWDENVELMRTFPEEIHAGLQLEEASEQYHTVSVPTLILTGTKSPDYLLQSAKELASMLPNVQEIALEGQHHNAPDETAPEAVAEHLQRFFA